MRKLWKSVAVFIVALALLASLSGCGASGPSKPTITTNSLSDGAVGLPYSDNVTASGGSGSAYNPPWSISSGSLPEGLSLNASTGEISGTPTKAGIFSFTVQVIDSDGNTNTRDLSITIMKEATVCRTGEVGVPYSETLTVNDPHGTIGAGGTTGTTLALPTWSIMKGNLPSGLSLDTPTHESIGGISGTPATAGTYKFTLEARWVQGNATGYVVITIVPALAFPGGSFPDGEVSASYHESLDGTSGGLGPYSISVASEVLPSGLLLYDSGSDGAVVSVRGTPDVAGTYDFTLRVTDSIGGTATGSVSITIIAGPTITTTSLPDGTVGVAYRATLQASGGSGAYEEWDIISGHLPQGLSLDLYLGVVSGTPTAPGTSTVKFRVWDYHGGRGSESLSITIVPAAGA